MFLIIHLSYFITFCRFRCDFSTLPSVSPSHGSFSLFLSDLLSNLEGAPTSSALSRRACAHKLNQNPYLRARQIKNLINFDQHEQLFMFLLLYLFFIFYLFFLLSLQAVGILINGSIPDLIGSKVECEYKPGVSTAATVYGLAQIQTCPLLPPENYQPIPSGTGEPSICQTHSIFLFCFLA